MTSVSAVPDTTGRVKLPKFVPRFGKLRDGTYTENDLLEYMNNMTMQEGFQSPGSYVLNATPEDVFDLFFADMAITRWDSVKGAFEYKFKEVSNWQKPKLEKYRGLPVKAERQTIYESKFDSKVAQVIANPIFNEIQKTFLLTKAENALIIESLSMA